MRTPEETAAQTELLETLIPPAVVIELVLDAPTPTISYWGLYRSPIDGTSYWSDESEDEALTSEQLVGYLNDKQWGLCTGWRTM